MHWSTHESTCSALSPSYSPAAQLQRGSMLSGSTMDHATHPQHTSVITLSSELGSRAALSSSTSDVPVALTFLNRNRSVNTKLERNLL